MNNRGAGDTPDGADEAAARSRLKGFVGHLLGYFIGMAIIVPVNLIFMPENIWFVLPMVGWGSLLALHVAYVMGFFGGGSER